jgi:hypothetical protein
MWRGPPVISLFFFIADVYAIATECFIRITEADGP